MNRVRILPLALVLLAALALTACGRRARATETVTTTTTTTGDATVATGASRPAISHRHYRNLLRVAARDMQCHQDDVTPQEVSPGIFSVAGCGQLRDYALVCRSHRRCSWQGIVPVEQAAMNDTQCATGPILVQPTGPLTRSVTACGQTLDYALGCLPGGCQWTRGTAAGGVVLQTEPGTSVIVVADETGQGAAGPEAAGSIGDEDADVVGVDAAETLQSLVTTRIAAIRQCTGGQTTTLHIRWSAQGDVSVTLAPPHAGTEAEACVQRMVGSLVIPGVRGPGEIQATL